MQSSDIFKVYDPTPSTREIPRCTAVFSRHKIYEWTTGRERTALCAEVSKHTPSGQY